MDWMQEKAKRIIGGRNLKPYEAQSELAHRFRLNRKEAAKLLKDMG